MFAKCCVKVQYKLFTLSKIYHYRKDATNFVGKGACELNSNYLQPQHLCIQNNKDILDRFLYKSSKKKKINNILFI